MSKYVKCPDAFTPLFDEAEKIAVERFMNQTYDPLKALFTMGGERYVMFRASSMSVAIRKELEAIIGNGADVAIYKIGKACGAADAEFYFEQYPQLEPPMRLALGPLQYPFLGHANVEILPQSNPTTENDCLLVNDHPNLYEAEAYIKAGMQSSRPLCHMSAGYAAGWCGKAFSLPLEAKQIMCEVCGHKVNRFVIAPVSRLRERVKEICSEFGCEVPR